MNDVLVPAIVTQMIVFVEQSETLQYCGTTVRLFTEYIASVNKNKVVIKKISTHL